MNSVTNVRRHMVGQNLIDPKQHHAQTVQILTDAFDEITLYCCLDHDDDDVECDLEALVEHNGDYDGGEKGEFAEYTHFLPYGSNTDVDVLVLGDAVFVVDEVHNSSFAAAEVAAGPILKHIAIQGKATDCNQLGDKWVLCFLLYHYWQRMQRLNQSHCALVSRDKFHANGDCAYDGLLVFVGHIGVGVECIDERHY